MTVCLLIWMEVLLAAGPVKSTPPAAPRASGLIMLLTDFGATGYLLGSLKGTIYRGYPEARIDTLSNDIQKFDIDEAAQTLVLASPDYPPGTLFVVVVDPGIGGPRTPIAVETQNGHIYLAPDNGVLTQVVIRHGLKRAFKIENPQVVRVEPSQSTFLSRDVFGPAAAAVARGMDIANLGEPIKKINMLTVSPPQVRDGVVYGTVTLIDGFGNVHTNIQREHLARLEIKEGDTLTLTVGDRRLSLKLVRTYGDVKAGTQLALVGNNNEVQLSVNQGSLARELTVRKGESVVLGKAP